MYTMPIHTWHADSACSKATGMRSHSGRQAGRCQQGRSQTVGPQRRQQGQRRYAGVTACLGDVLKQIGALVAVAVEAGVRLLQEAREDAEVGEALMRRLHRGGGGMCGHGCHAASPGRTTAWLMHAHSGWVWYMVPGVRGRPDCVVDLGL